MAKRKTDTADDLDAAFFTETGEVHPEITAMVKRWMGEPEKPICTCNELSKQRALCPVCDKEEYEKMKKENHNAMKSKKRVTVWKRFVARFAKGLEKLINRIVGVKALRKKQNR